MRRVGIIGGSESGVGAALLALSQDLVPFVSDYGVINDAYKKVLIEKSINFEENGHSFDLLSTCDMIVKSPGVPAHAPIISQLLSTGIPIISEIEFGSRYYQGKILAITGSNGKTTTAGLLYHTLSKAGLDVKIGGNYGYSFAGIIAEDNPEYIVLEISSFQLDDVTTFKPYIATILNITADHLDRYDYDITKYGRSKYKICKNQDANDYFIYNATDPESLKLLPSVNSSVKTIGVDVRAFDQGILKSNGEPMAIALKGKHNLYNSYVVKTFCEILGLSENQIEDGLSTFINLPHRLEVIRVLDGVTYINDSKATNIDSVYYALEAMTTPVVWIVGGQDKGNDYGVLAPLVAEKIRSIVCMGADNQKLLKAYQAYDVYSTSSVTEAVQIARAKAKIGDTVLLSPACASFDLFKNYMDRGDQFRNEVYKLI
ncbi:MAG TPA: UDP-N-acetylmuramoyl-L-alanine--D-glutamate ligase [Saprospiraceae bacterium]|nr:UDP-N-acetylmuramoyl-L-alanine--D-glutamate ligase [Saprospiraceae bacterium]